MIGRKTGNRRDRDQGRGNDDRSDYGSEPETDREEKIRDRENWRTLTVAARKPCTVTMNRKRYAYKKYVIVVDNLIRMFFSRHVIRVYREYRQWGGEEQ